MVGTYNLSLYKVIAWGRLEAGPVGGAFSLLEEESGLEAAQLPPGFFQDQVLQLLSAPLSFRTEMKCQPRSQGGGGTQGGGWQCVLADARGLGP